MSENQFQVTGSPKSKGIGILLIVFLGPLGLLYASLEVAYVACCLYLPTFFFSLYEWNNAVISGKTILILLLLFYPGSLVLSIYSIDKYNRKLMTEGERIPEFSMPFTEAVTCAGLGLLLCCFIFFVLTMLS